jgi:hypothetical protein
MQLGAIAHAIRLGKRPRPGMIMGGNMRLDELNTVTGELKPGAEKTPVEFEVTQELLDEAAAEIDAQRAVFREPKTTVLSLGGVPIPAAVWDAYARQGRKKR